MMPLSKSPASDGSVGAFFSDIYLTAITTQHLTWQLNIMASIAATHPSHYLT